MQDIHSEIERLRGELGSRVTIMGHHYQSDEIIRHVQITGDSLELSRKVAGVDSESIVFCGVYFMAESAALLARPGQKVYLPEPDADCVMAQMAPARLLDTVMQNFSEQGMKVLPLAYVNTSLAVKAVVGKHFGAVCTSANAETMLRWAFKNADKVLFLPDKNLGRNTANTLGIPSDEQLILNVTGKGANIQDISEKTRLLLWPGQCAIHARFKPSHISELRAEYPGIKIATHPECAPEIVDMSDAVGSTSFLIKFANEAPDGSVIGIGTEYNLVHRLAEQHKGRIKIIPLLVSVCSCMAQTTPEALLKNLKGLAGEDLPAVPVQVEAGEAEPAKLALTRMLDACK